MVLVVIVVVVVVILVMFVVFAARPAEHFSAMNVFEKRKSIMSYVGILPDRSAVGQWTQTEDAAFAALLSMVDGQQAISPGLYSAQRLLNAKGFYSGKVDGVSNPAYIKGSQAFVASLDPAVIKIIRALRTV